MDGIPQLISALANGGTTVGIGVLAVVVWQLSQEVTKLSAAMTAEIIKISAAMSDTFKQASLVMTERADIRDRRIDALINSITQQTMILMLLVGDDDARKKIAEAMTAFKASETKK